MSQGENYLVLARKYRPQSFKDLYGQDALVQTLTNAITSGRLHHAYVLTGIRGTGKTTTARIIAKALNCENGPAIEWDENDSQVVSIAKGNHPDVLEFDAASHRGVEEISDLFEGVAYAPVMGRRKIYIIDEVHMLSKHAFNALLKTLEEPPENVTFIFATTEVHKIPVTVLSRCQRFDLRRIPVATLMQLYQHIAQQEGLDIEEDALRTIATAADGSARDGTSLLDQAIALSAGQAISTQLVNEMLGLGDKTKVVNLLETIFDGDVSGALTQLDDLYALGQDPILLLNESMQLVDMLTRLKVVKGLDANARLTELERSRLVPLAQKLPLEKLARLYQMLLNAASEARQADRPFEAVSMAIVRVAHLAGLPPVADLLKQAPQLQSKTVEQRPQKEIELAPSLPQNVQQAAPWEGEQKDVQVETENISAAPTSWSEIVKLIQTERPALGAILAQQGRPSEINGQKIIL